MAEIVSAFLTGLRANPDLNSDGIVDSADMCIVVDHWHTSEPSCDITPPPFGDGIVLLIIMGRWSTVLSGNLPAV